MSALLEIWFNFGVVCVKSGEYVQKCFTGGQAELDDFLDFLDFLEEWIMDQMFYQKSHWCQNFCI